MHIYHKLIFLIISLKDYITFAYIDGLAHLKFAETIQYTNVYVTKLIGRKRSQLSTDFD